MKTNSIIKSALFTVGFSAFTLIGSAKAQLVNVDLNTPTSATYSGQGVIADPGANYFNGLSTGFILGGSTYTSSTLLAADGSTNTGFQLKLTPIRPGSPTTAQDNYISTSYNYGAPNALLGDGLYNTDGNGDGNNADGNNFTFSGLTTGHTYTLAVYLGGYFDTETADVTIGSTMLTATNTGSDSGFVNGADYVEFTNITAVGGQISGFVGQVGTATMLLSGFSIQDTTPVPMVPEPSTYALMGLGALALLVVSRRRRTV